MRLLATLILLVLLAGVGWGCASHPRIVGRWDLERVEGELGVPILDAGITFHPDGTLRGFLETELGGKIERSREEGTYRMDDQSVLALSRGARFPARFWFREGLLVIEDPVSSVRLFYRRFHGFKRGG